MTPAGTTSETVGQRDASVYEERSIYYRPAKAFDHGLPDVPVHAFSDELDQVLDPRAPSGIVALDLRGPLHLPYPATTPLFLGRYCLIRSGDTLGHHLSGTVEVHYVLRGRGVSANSGDEIAWGPGDCICFPGGRDTVHRAQEDTLLFTVTNEPELEYNHTAPRQDTPVVATAFRAERIQAELDVVHATTGSQMTAGKSVSFTTQAMHQELSGALTPSMMVAINTLEPGGVQRRHRHNSVAITVAIAGDETYSVVGDKKLTWRRFGVMVTPPRVAHSHVNPGKELMRSLVVQDGPVFYNCRSVGFEWTEETL